MHVLMFMHAYITYDLHADVRVCVSMYACTSIDAELIVTHACMGPRLHVADVAVHACVVVKYTCMLSSCMFSRSVCVC